MELNLSQTLTIKGDRGLHYTISAPSETDSSFASCDENGCCDWLPFEGHAWFALTDEAKKVFTGDTKTEDGIILGRIFCCI